ncbi:MAG: hypothetical protein KDB73_18995, partial [Planctomycetes bacterium]|nr:hypothetical protein [Planctomycetota bacterium]
MAEVESAAPRVALTLLRARRRDTATPSVVAIEFDIECADHIGLIVLVATLCDLAPSAKRALSCVRGSEVLARERRERLVGSLLTRMQAATSEPQVLAALDEALCLPSTDPVASDQRARIVMEAASLLQASIDPAALAFFGDAVRTRALGAPAPIAAYRRVARLLRPPARRLARAHIAEQYARALAPSVHTEVARLRAELRAERYAKLAGLPVRAAYLRSHRRKTVEQYRAAGPDDAALLMCRPLLLCGSRIPPWPACYAALYIGVVGGRLSATHAWALARAWESAGSPYRLEPRMQAWLRLHLPRGGVSRATRSSSAWELCERNSLERLSSDPAGEDPSISIPLGIYSLGLLGSTCVGTSTLNLSASRGAL